MGSPPRFGSTEPHGVYLPRGSAPRPWKRLLLSSPGSPLSVLKAFHTSGCFLALFHLFSGQLVSPFQPSPWTPDAQQPRDDSRYSPA